MRLRTCCVAWLAPMWVIPAACEQDFYVGGKTPSVVTENGTTTGCRDSVSLNAI